MDKVWPLQMSSTQKIVLLSLADQADQNGRCWPSVGTICKRTCLCERAVQSAISRLESDGHIRREHRHGRSTHYFVTPAANAPQQEIPLASVAPTPAQVAPPPPQHVHPDPASSAPITVSETLIDPSIETAPLKQSAKNHAVSRKNSVLKTTQFNPLDIALPDWLSREVWERWIKYCRETNKRLTSMTVLSQMAFLTKHHAQGADCNEIIEVSIRNGWSGIFPPKNGVYVSKKNSPHSLHVDADKNWNAPL